MNFIAIDIETANSKWASICQIGIAQFSEGRLIGEWSTLINPEDYFDSMNVSIHGIHPSMVKDKPTLLEVAAEIRELMEDTISISHSPFDKYALTRGFAKYEIDPVETTWLDSAKMVRRTWSDLAQRGWGLSNVCKKIGYSFKHHDALEDAKACGHVVLAAISASKIELGDWIIRESQPIDLDRVYTNSNVKRIGTFDGPLHGETVVFTGALQITRVEAAELAAKSGCNVSNTVNKKTTVLVVGDQDTSKFAGHEKSSKHRKAEELVLAGQRIRVVLESDFKEMVHAAYAPPLKVVRSTAPKKLHCKSPRYTEISLSLGDDGRLTVQLE